MRVWLVLLALMSTLTPAFADERVPAIGDVIGELRFKDIRGLQRSLADLGRKRAYVFVFTTTQCPLVKRTMPKLIELDAKFGPQDVQIVDATHANAKTRERWSYKVVGSPAAAVITTYDEYYELVKTGSAWLVSVNTFQKVP